MANESLCLKMLVERIWDTHEPRHVRMKSFQCCSLVFFLPFASKKRVVRRQWRSLASKEGVGDQRSLG